MRASARPPVPKSQEGSQAAKKKIALRTALRREIDGRVLYAHAKRRTPPHHAAPHAHARACAHQEKDIGQDLSGTFPE